MSSSEIPKPPELVVFDCPNGFEFDELRNLESIYSKITCLPGRSFENLSIFKGSSRWTVFCTPEIIHDFEANQTIMNVMSDSKINTAIGYPKIVSKQTSWQGTDPFLDLFEIQNCLHSATISVEISVSPFFMVDMDVVNIVGGSFDSIENFLKVLRTPGLRGLYCPQIAIISRGEVDFPANDFYQNQRNLSKLYLEKVKYRASEPKILIDARGLQPHYNGTSKYITSLIPKIVETYQGKIEVLVNEEAYAFHNLQNLTSPTVFKFSIDSLKHYDHAIILSQPFSRDVIESLSEVSLTISCIMHDIIAVDIGMEAGISADSFWFELSDLVDHIFFISEYSKDIFIERYGCGTSYSVVSNPFDISAYSPSCLTLDSPILDPISKKQRILVVGNKLKHKNVENAVNHLSKIEEFETFEFPNGPGFGKMNNNEVDKLYQWSDAVVYPSLYEGFGLPIFESLAHKRICYVPKNTHNIRMAELYPKNIRLFTSYPELVEELKKRSKFEDYPNYDDWTWASIAGAFQTQIKTLLDRLQPRQVSKWLKHG
jgi:glycosyltransferase involved in cell wall biosynthesis